MAQVTISDGVLEGELVDNEYGGKYFSFKGIPYAEPPIGELRFKAPQPPKPWDGVRSATEHGPMCYQYDPMLKQPASGSEDCLYLNVYTPEIKPAKPLPVMVFIHGGGFVCGSGDDVVYGPKFLVRHGVVLVTFNYRLEIMGFLCLDTEDVPGNAGMKDQVAALKWVRDNISNFGGDVENITIFGESAGSASATFHMVSPMSKGLFKRVIAQSGVATNYWTQTFEPRQKALALAKQLGCYSEDDTELYEFFKSQPIEALILTKVPITFSEASQLNGSLLFSIVSEKQFGDNERFFYGDIVKACENSIHEGIDLMAGYCAHEGLLSLAGGDIDHVMNQANNYLQVFVPHPMALTLPLKSQFEIARKVKTFYFKNEKISTDNFDQLVKFFSMYMFVYEITNWLNSSVRTEKGNVYLYKFSCYSEVNLLTEVFELRKLFGDKKMVCHGDDLGYMFDGKVLPQRVDVNSKAFEMIENVCKLWTNFAKFGNPTPDDSLGVQWQQYTSDEQNYLDIGEQLEARAKPEPEELHLWEELHTVFYRNRHLIQELERIFD